MKRDPAVLITAPTGGDGGRGSNIPQVSSKRHSSCHQRTTNTLVHRASAGRGWVSCCVLTEKSCKLPAERIFARPTRLTPDIHADTFRGSVAKNRARLPKVVPRRSAPTGTTAGHRPLGRLRYADRDARGAMGRRARRTSVCRQRCTDCRGDACVAPERPGGVAQLGERVNGIHEVRGSIPLASISWVRTERDGRHPRRPLQHGRLAQLVRAPR